MKESPSFSQFLTSKKISQIDLHVVLGSGFGSALDIPPPSWTLLGDLPFNQVEGLVASTVPDHKGAFRFFQKAGKTIAFQMGRLHGYEGHDPSLVVRPVMLSRFYGTKNFLLTNASGGLSTDFKPGDVMLIRDHVNLTGKNPLVGHNPVDPKGREFGPRFPDLTDLYDSEWRTNLALAFKQQKLNVQSGIYLGLLGTSFETHAEVNLFASWGLHAVGMSTVWEAIALRHSGARLAGLSLISNMAAGIAGKLDHLEILKTCRSSAEKICGGIFQWFESEKI